MKINIYIWTYKTNLTDLDPPACHKISDKEFMRAVFLTASGGLNPLCLMLKEKTIYINKITYYFWKMGLKMSSFKIKDWTPAITPQGPPWICTSPYLKSELSEKKNP